MPQRLFFSWQSEPELRAKEKRRLSSNLEAAVRSIISQFDASNVSDEQVGYSPIPPGDGLGRIRGFNDYLCIRQDGEAVHLPATAYAFLRFIPSQSIRQLTNIEARQIAQAHLRPMTGLISGGYSTGRHESGAVSFWTASAEPTIALDTSEIFLTGEIWGNCFYLLNTPRSKERGFNFIPTGALEETFIDAFINYREIAHNQLKHTLPIEVRAGVVLVDGYKLAVDPRYFGYEEFVGPILGSNILFEAKLSDWDSDPFDILEPFFSKIYDIAGEQRPAIRQAGRSQR
ncbi:MAG: hypothetical protein KF810_03245 [Rhizobiaceae bacterium]|nr:hypothetical protein [Rhizobiaceae bacterium]